IDGVLEHEDTKAVIAKAKELSSSTAIEAKKLIGSVADELKEVDMNHKEIADKVETVSMGLSIASGVVAAGAALAAPTGLSAVGVALGITSTPLIVTAAPVIGAVATAAGVVSGSAYFYSKWKMKKEKDNDHATFPDTRMQTIEADNPAIEPQLRPRRGGRVVD
ncbi:MAG: hypothetical protein LBI87_08450, partial [Candidatus Accumulibacter sp.]|nr:hypothetical protein [Accumulibacter sp.]